MRKYTLKVTILKPFCDDYCHVYLEVPHGTPQKEIEEKAKEEALKIFDYKYNKDDMSVWFIL